MRKEAVMGDPKDPKVIYQATGVGSGGGPKPHLWADLVQLIELKDSARARLFVHAAFLAQITDLASDIRDQHPAAYEKLSKAISASAEKLGTTIENFDFNRES
jgi:hypothetical protein